MKTSKLSDFRINRLVRSVLLEEESNGGKGKKQDKKTRCIPENVIPLDEIVGKANEYNKYTNGITKRTSGVNSMVDTLGILNNLEVLVKFYNVNIFIESLIGGGLMKRILGDFALDNSRPIEVPVYSSILSNHHRSNLSRVFLYHSASRG